MDFRQWLENEEQIELRVANFIYDKIKRAGEALAKDIEAGNNIFNDPSMQGFDGKLNHHLAIRAFIERYLTPIWGGNPGPKNSQLMLPPDQFPEDVASKPISFIAWPVDEEEYGEAEHDDQGIYQGMRFNLMPLINNDAQQIRASIPRIGRAIHHESEHIYNVGSNLQGGPINYLSNPGEMAAHSREAAFAYSQKYPGEPYDPQKMAALAPELGVNFHNYQKMGDPAKQSQYPGHDFAGLHRSVMDMIPRYHQQYQAT